MLHVLNLEQAEELGTAEAWETFARALLAERENSIKPKQTKAKSKAPAGENLNWLTLTERRARNLPPRKQRKHAGGQYVNVLVEFVDGVQMLVGQYPRKVGKLAGETERDEAIAWARARYLLLKSGGEFMSFRAKCPRVKAWRDVQAHELEDIRRRCSAIYDALVAFTFAPAWEEDQPRPIAWVKHKYQAKLWSTPGEGLQSDPALQKIIAQYCGRPVWWLAEYQPEQFREHHNVAPRVCEPSEAWN